MVAYDNEGPFTMTTGAAVNADALLAMSGSSVIHCPAGGDPVGISTEAVASGGKVAVKTLNGCVRKVTASAAISAGAAIYAAATGRVSSSAVGRQLGVALAAATAAGGKIPAIMWGPRGGNDMLAARGYTFEYFDDFEKGYDQTATVGDYAEVHDGTPATDIGDASHGVMSLATGATDNNETYISSMHEIYLFETDKYAFFEARVKLTEANTDDANIIVGLSDTVAADSLVDNGAGPMASYDGCVFFKVDGTMTWQFETSNAATQATNTSVGTYASATWYRLGFFYDYNDGVTASVTPYLDGVAGTAKDLTIAGLAEMHILFGAKAGGANAETLLVDYVHLVAER